MLIVILPIVFDPPSSNLTYSGIYRFLNNPERVLGLAGVWGLALITWNPPIFYLAATAHILNLAFLQFVERPHMQRYVLAFLHKGPRVTSLYDLYSVAIYFRSISVGYCARDVTKFSKLLLTWYLQIIRPQASSRKWCQQDSSPSSTKSGAQLAISSRRLCQFNR